jgi:parallel beta helix pectate lyase-like protein
LDRPLKEEIGLRQKPSPVRPAQRLALAFLPPLAIYTLATWISTTRVMSAPTSAPACPADAIKINPDASVQDAVDAAQEGAVFCLKAGTYRLQQVIPKNGQSFYSDGRVVFIGARKITTFERDGELWVAVGQEQANARRGVCAKQFPTCNMPDVLFIDDRALRRVLSKEEVTEGTYYFDHAGKRIYFANDPQSHVIEATVMNFAFAGPAANVRIDGIVVEKYSTPAQRGAINGSAGKNWTVSDVEARWNSGAGISVGPGGHVIRSKSHHNGQLGVNAFGGDIVIEENEVWNNNVYGFDPAWEAGGIKVALADHVVLRNNRVYRNGGSGLWCDINCRNVVYEGNTIEFNDGPGIFYEISFEAVIRHNTLRYNGASGFRWVWNSEIQIAGSEHVQVYENHITVRPGGGSVMLIDQGRAPEGGFNRKYETRNNEVHNNWFLFEGDGRAGGASDRPPSDENYRIISDGKNFFDFNAYYKPKDSNLTFAWGHGQYVWSEFQKFGQETHGSITAY